MYVLHAWLGYSNCRSTSRPPPPSRVPFPPALSVEFTTENINEVNESPIVCRTRFTKCFHGVGAILLVWFSRLGFGGVGVFF